MVRKNVVTKRTNFFIRWRWVLLVGVSAVLFFSAGILVQQHEKTLTNVPSINSYFTRIKTWLAAYKNREHSMAKKKKQIATNKNDNTQTIHFEFYTALPTMRVVVPDKAQQPTQKENKQHKVNPAPAKIANADRLAQEFKDRLSK